MRSVCISVSLQVFSVMCMHLGVWWANAPRCGCCARRKVAGDLLKFGVH